MSALDFVIVLVIVASAIYGWARGLISQLGSVGGIALGILLCRVFGTMLSGWLGHSHAETNDTTLYIDSVIANASLFAAGYFGAFVAARLLRRLTRVLMLGVFDRLAGVIFSVFAWLLALSIALNVWQCLNPDDEFARYSRLNDGRAVTIIMELAPEVLGGYSFTQLFGGD